MADEHVPVLYEEVLQGLALKPNGRYLDGTLGAGGHTAGILQATAPNGRVLAFDRDPAAIAFAQQRLAEYGDRVIYINRSYAEMGSIAPAHGFTECDGILLDLGLSSHQLHDENRGFSFLRQGPLDMRFDPTQGKTAADLLNELPEAELADIFWRFGEEPHSRRYASLIVAHRPLTTTTQLADLIASQVKRRGRIHPATQLFQALRIAVNQELVAVEKGIQTAVQLLARNGRLAVISFHSLEDRFVKQTFRQLSQTCVCPPNQPTCTCGGQANYRLVKRKAIQPSEAEIAANSRSRSARLRILERLQ